MWLLGCTYPVFPLVFKLLLKPVDLFLQDVDPLRELGGCQLLFLIVAGAKGWAPSATKERFIILLTSPSAPSCSPRMQNHVKCRTWQTSGRLVVREVLRCRPGTAGTVRRRRSGGTASGRCLPPAAGGSNVPRREGTVELPRGPCSPSVVMSTLVLALSDKNTHTPQVKMCLFAVSAVKQILCKQITSKTAHPLLLVYLEMTSSSFSQDRKLFTVTRCYKVISLHADIFWILVLWKRGGGSTSGEWHANAPSLCSTPGYSLHFDNNYGLWK